MPDISNRSESRQAAVKLVRERGLEHRDEPFLLASGLTSNEYVDVKRAFDSGARLQLVSRAIAEVAVREDIEFDAVGGLTMGADPFAHGVAMVTGKGWFSVRKDHKLRGREQWLEGYRLEPGDEVLLLDDVVTTGESIIKAYDRVSDLGAFVAGAIPVLDRGKMASSIFAEHDIPYFPLMTYRDLGIDPVEFSW